MPAFKPVAFESDRRRRRGGLPRWLVLMLIGAALGVAGVIGAQERLLPPRLTAGESATLRASLAQAQAERDRLKGELADTAKRLQSAQTQAQSAAADLAADRERTKSARADYDFLVASMPPDPRGGAVEVRAARFAAKGAELGYEVLLTRDEAAAAPAVMQLVVSGRAGAAERTATLDPVPLSPAARQIVRGSLPLPVGLDPRMVTLRVLDRPGGRALGMRVMYVR